MITKIQIYGERCSGTNYLEELLLLNFDVEIIWSYGWKHFFGFNDVSNSDDVLFIGIIRNLEDWINSLYREKHHLPVELTKNIDAYLNNTFYSIEENGNEMMNDRNIETNERYKNIFELRHIKNKFLIETMPTLVKNYCLITHDDLINNFVDTMNKIKNCNLQIKQNINYPLNIYYYQKDKAIIFKKKQNEITAEIIMKHENLFYEKILFEKINILERPEEGGRPNYVGDSRKSYQVAPVEPVAPITQVASVEPIAPVPKEFSRSPALSNFAHSRPTTHNGVNGRKIHLSENSFCHRVAPSWPISQLLRLAPTASARSKRFFIPLTPPQVMGMGLRVRR